MDDFSEYRARKIADMANRMKTLGLTVDELAEKSEIDKDLIIDIINKDIRFIDDDTYDILASVLHWEKSNTYFRKKKA